MLAAPGLAICLAIAGAQPAADTSTAIPLEIDERLRAEEAWAAKEHERRQGLLDGGADAPLPPPGVTPRPGPPIWLLAIVGVGVGAGWGAWHKRRRQRRRKRR